MKTLFYVIVFISLCSCSYVPYRNPEGSLAMKNNALSVQDKDKGRIVVYWYDPLKAESKEDSSFSLACFVNGERFAVMRGGSMSDVKVIPGVHSLNCKKVHVYMNESKEDSYKNSKKYGESHTVNFKINKKETLFFNLYSSSPIVSQTSRAAFEKYETDHFDYLISENSEIKIESSAMPVAAAPMIRKSNKNVNKTNTAKRAPASKGVSSTVSDKASECASYFAAKKTCEYLPFGSSICISGLNSQFDQTVIELCSGF